MAEGDIVRLFEVRGGAAEEVVAAADDLRRSVSGDAVTYVINRNINYTNICLYKCGFCAFSKGSTRAERGPAYRLDLAEVGRRAAEAVERSATEVCLQGGIHPDYDGKAGDRDQTMYFEVAYKNLIDGKVQATINSCDGHHQPYPGFFFGWRRISRL